MSVNTVEKLTFTKEQLITASLASKQFGELRKKARMHPMFITDNGDIDTVIVGYEYFEQMFQRLKELEQQEEEKILAERIERLEKNPSGGIPWRSVRRSGRD